MTPRDRLQQIKARCEAARGCELILSSSTEDDGTFDVTLTINADSIDHARSLEVMLAEACWDAPRLVAFTEDILDRIEGLALLAASPVVDPNDREIYRNAGADLRALADQHLGGVED